MNEAMGFSLALLQHSLLVLFGEPDVKLGSPMSMHEFETADLEFYAAELVQSLCDIRELQNPSLKRFAQK
jgi:hypothetical protein